MPKVRIIKQFLYNGVVLRPGETVDIENSTITDLVYRGRVEIIKQNMQEYRPKSGKRVAIVGTARTRVNTPYNDNGCEIWTVSHRFDKFERQDRHIEIHHPDRLRGNAEYFNWLKQNQKKLFIAEPMPELPEAEIYPQKEIMSEFGDFFTNSISWMIALAIYKKFEVIELYGIDMAKGSEYHFEKPSVLYYMGFAVGRGIRVSVAKLSKILEDTSAPLGDGLLKFNTLFYLGVAAGCGVKFQVTENNDLFKKDFLYWKY